MSGMDVDAHNKKQKKINIKIKVMKLILLQQL
jgi:hypothetical protein